MFFFSFGRCLQFCIHAYQPSTVWYANNARVPYSASRVGGAQSNGKYLPATGMLEK
jgi:hypothetical protein